MENIFGFATQFYFAIGWLPNKLVLSVNPRTKRYESKFTLQTYNVENKLTIVHCVCEGEVAKQIVEQYKKFDIIIVFGQIQHFYNPMTRVTTNRIKVLGFVLPVLFKNNMDQPIISDEAEDMLRYVQKKAFEYYSKKQATPSDKEIKYWVDIYKKRGY